MVVEIKEHMFVWYDTDKSTAVSVSSCGIYKSISRTMWCGIQYYTIWYTILAAMLYSTRSSTKSSTRSMTQHTEYHCYYVLTIVYSTENISAYAPDTSITV